MMPGHPTTAKQKPFMYYEIRSFTRTIGDEGGNTALVVKVSGVKRKGRRQITSTSTVIDVMCTNVTTLQIQNSVLIAASRISWLLYGPSSRPRIPDTCTATHARCLGPIASANKSCIRGSAYCDAKDKTVSFVDTG